MADIPFRHAYLFNSYPSQICFMFLLLTFYRPGFIFLFNYFLLSIAVCHSSFFILLCHPLCFILCLCTPSLLLAAMFESCTTSLCFCFALFCFFFHPPPAVCLLAIRTVRARCWVLLSGLKTFEIIRARYCEKLQAVSSAGLLYIRKDDYSKTLSGDYT